MLINDILAIEVKISIHYFDCLVISSNRILLPCGNFVTIFDCLSVLVIFYHRHKVLFPELFQEPKGLHEAVEEAVPATVPIHGVSISLS